MLAGVSGKAAAEPRTIKRYGNRKLYDPAARRYVTLEQLAGLRGAAARTSGCWISATARISRI